MKNFLFLIGALFLTSRFIDAQGFEVTPNIPPMNVTRYYHSSVSLPEGKVLVVGGHTQGFGVTATAEIYDPLANSWTLYNIDNVHDGSSYVELSDGRFMFFGGFPYGGGYGQSNATTIFDPSTSVFTNGPQMNVARAYSSAVKLTDNRVLIVGNWYNTGNAEIYNPTDNTFTTIGTPIIERSNPVLFPCNDGSAVIIAGHGIYGSPNYSDIVHYNPITNQFATLSSELIAGETGWITSWSSNSGELSKMKLSNGKYIFMIYKTLSSGVYNYAFATFDPETKEVVKLSSTPSLPIYNGTSPLDWGFSIGMIKNPTSDIIYIMAVGSSPAPYINKMYSFDVNSGVLSIPFSSTSFNYYIHSANRAWSNDKILFTGGTISGNNYDITNSANLLRPEIDLATVDVQKNTAEIQVFPNPVTGSNFQIKTTIRDLFQIDIYNMNGQLVKSNNVNPNDKTHLIDRSTISSGVYILKLSGSKSIATKKIIFK